MNNIDGRYILRDMDGMICIIDMIRDYMTKNKSIPEKTLTNLNAAREHLATAFNEMRKEIG